MNTNKKLGSQGESFVCSQLEQQGYTILETNYASRYGEVDIIAQEGDELCFIEVKTRLDESYGDPLEAITPVKRRKLIRLAQGYILEHELEDSLARFDVVSVLGNPEAGARLEIIKNAFEVQ